MYRRRPSLLISAVKLLAVGSESPFLIAKRFSPYLNSYYEGIRSRRGTGRAIIALARKFLGVIYRTLKNNWVFEDFPNFVLRETAA